MAGPGAPLRYTSRGKLGGEGRELTPDTSVSPPLLKIEGEEREGPRYVTLRGVSSE